MEEREVAAACLYAGEQGAGGSVRVQGHDCLDPKSEPVQGDVAAPHVPSHNQVSRGAGRLKQRRRPATRRSPPAPPGAALRRVALGGDGGGDLGGEHRAGAAVDARPLVGAGVRLLVLRHRRVLDVLGPERAGVDHDGKVAEGVELGDPLAVEVVAAVDEAALQPREVHLGQEREVLHAERIPEEGVFPVDAAAVQQLVAAVVDNGSESLTGACYNRDA